MSLHLPAVVDFPGKLPVFAAPMFLLGQNTAGMWVIRETTGRRAGLFCSREAAIKYARSESPVGKLTIIDSPQGLELDESKLDRAA